MLRMDDPSAAAISEKSNAQSNAADLPKNKLKQKGDNLRRRRGIGSAKYAEFFFQFRALYPFSRRTFPLLGGRVEGSLRPWDGTDPCTGAVADWLNPEDVQHFRARMRLDGKNGMVGRSVGVKRLRAATPSSEETVTCSSDGSHRETTTRELLETNSTALQKDTKVLMDALRRIPTARRAALALEGMLSKQEIQDALREYGTGKEFGLTERELAVIAILQNSTAYRPC